MNNSTHSWRTAGAVFVVVLFLGTSAIFAFQVTEKTGRFDKLVIADPMGSLDAETTALGTLSVADGVRAGWESFRTAHGPEWSIYLDRRSGAPLLVEGQGISWPIRKDTTVESLADSLRAFIAGNKALLLADDAELVFNKRASGVLLDDVWQVVFDRMVAGIPVDGERYVFTVGHGNLISFGTSRWSRIDASPFPDLSDAEARERLSSYMGLKADDVVEFVGKPGLEFMPLRSAAPGGTIDGPYTGAIGSGYASALVWRVTLTVSGDQGLWVALVDAHTGQVRAFFDTVKYARVKGGVYPLTSDQVCPEGCEQPNYPMPFAKMVSYQPDQTATSSGFFSCPPSGEDLATKFQGHYFRIGSQCGLFVQSTPCGTDMDLGTAPDVQCAVPAGASRGDSHALRTAYYHLNRAAEHARGWLPDIEWPNSQVDVNVDPLFPGAPPQYVTTCNAYWSCMGGCALNFLRGAEGCRNCGEIAGVMYHEWGHGLDDNDGGGTDNPGEAYADIVSTLATHLSCVGRGFQKAGPLSTGNCTGYGNNCIACTGVRDLDWDMRVAHTPSTPSGFVATRCNPGEGPCGKEVHCEGYLGGEMLWDLATRDLTAMGLDLPSAWQLADKLWYLSRRGSGGPAWNCPLPNSDGCFETSWFTRMRVLDDDDGNLANGTPHAAAIFAAYDRHKIGCGHAGDASNQNHTSCPTIGASPLAVSTGNGSASLSWSPVANAVKYRVLKNEAGCQAGSTVVAYVTGTTYNDTGLANGMTEFYTVQAVGANAACDGPASNCQAATPEPFGGTVTLGASGFSCNGQINVTVTDGNIGAATTTVSLVSTTETTPESITLTQIAPGSDTYTGSIATTTSAPVHDGALSIANGDTITANYLEENDGGGGHVDIPRVATATVDCVPPVISKVQAKNVTGSSATITWSTNEPATSVVHYGTAAPPGSTTSVPTPVLGHGVDLAGLAECTSYVFSVDSTDAVGNFATDNALGTYYSFSTGKTTQTSYTSTDTPIVIPDNNPSGAASTVTVPDARIVQDVNVAFNVQHPFDSDLTFKLIAPTGLTILLAHSRGDSADNYTNTVLDDEAAVPIDLPAPFTGTFRPDSPLYVADGIDAAGDWKLLAVDANGQDVGTILSWTLQLTFATPSCGPHALLRSAARVSDICVAGGPGNGNTYWDAGEDVQFQVKLANDGTTPLTGVTAEVTSTTPGVVMSDGIASFPDIPASGSADSLAPHFTVHLPTSLACGGAISFQVAIHADQGTWPGAFDQAAGRATNGTGRVLGETFDNGIPATWSVLDGGSGGNAASTWTAANPGVRTIAAPMILPVATVDSDAAGPGATQDEALLSPVLNLQTATTATLQFDEFFRWFAGGLNEIADVDVRSSLTGGAWVNVLRQQGASSANPAHKIIDVSAQAAGAADAQLRFRDWNGSNEQYWQIDNVTIDTSAPGSCAMPSCAPTAGGAKPVADGSFGVAMKGSRANASGSTIAVTWDVSVCVSADHHILYGNLANVASTTVVGAVCDLGTTGSVTWSGAPAGNLWFVVVGDDNATTEASWGTDGIGGQRGGVTPSGFCGLTTRDNSGVCP